MPHGAINMTEEGRESRGKDLCKLIEMDLRDRRQAIVRRTVARNIYDNTAVRSPRYRGASNIHLPVLEEKVEGMVPKLVNAFFGAEPMVNVSRVEGEFDPEGTENNERFLNWAASTDIANFYQVSETWFRNMLLDGLSVLKIFWDRRWRNTVDVQGVKTSWRAGDVDFSQQQVEEDRPKVVLEAMADYFQSLSTIEPLDGAPDVDSTPVADALGAVYRVSFVEGRREYNDVTVEISESQYVDEIDLVVYRPILVSNKPSIEVVEYEDLILPYRTWDLQSAERVSQRYWLSTAELKQRIDEEGWHVTEEEFEKLKNNANTWERDQRDPTDRTMARQRDRAAGEHPTSGPGHLEDDEAPYVDGKFLIYEVYVTDDINDDGTVEEMVYQIPGGLKKVVKAHFLEELFPHGRRPFVDAHYIRMSDRWYSKSLGEQLTPINLEVDTIINMVNEAQELINNPFFFYVPHSNTVDPEVLKGLEPGQGIPVADVNGIMFPKFAQEPLANLSAIDSMLLFADRLTISPQASGGSSQVRNAPRTARGTLALLSEAGIKVDVIITALQKGGWRELFNQMHALYGAFGDDETWFNVTGEERPRRITPQDMRGRFDYQFSGNSVNTNREVMRSIAQVRYNTLISNPLFSMDLNALAELTRDFLRHFSEGTDVDKLMPKLPGQGATHPPMDQRTENQIMGQGQPVAVLPTDNHLEHMQEIESFSRTPAFEQLPEWAVALIGAHQSQHSLAAQQQITQGGPAAGGGQANNVPTGMSNAPTQTDLNALEGGPS